MPSLKIRRIDCAAGDAAAQLARPAHQLSAQGNVVSARGRELTQKVFGEPLPPVRVVERVCEDVRQRGADALFHYTEQFDRVRLDGRDVARHPRRNGAGPRRRRSRIPGDGAPRAARTCCRSRPACCTATP